MMSTLNPHDDRDALSALFDGELQGDAARFALKRLAHDPQWRESFSRWQLVGDALRGQATAAAPPDFAAGVAARLAREPGGAVVAGNFAGRAAASTRVDGTAASPRRRWLGGAALAASVAMAALFVTLPFPAGDSIEAAAPAMASAPAAPQAAPDSAPPRSEPLVAAGVAAVAVVDAPRRVAERRSRGQSQRAALRAQQPVAAARAAASAPAEPALAAASAAPTPADPFRPQAGDGIATRPWPRAALPNYPATGALTASSGTSLAAPSFYPFEPRLHAAEAPPAEGSTGPQP